MRVSVRQFAEKIRKLGIASDGGANQFGNPPGSATARRARAVGHVRLLAGNRRAVLHLDPDHDASGLLVVDLEAGTVLDAVTAHDLVASPDGRFWAFEEHAVRTIAVWPHTETVYAVYDAAAPPSAQPPAESAFPAGAARDDDQVQASVKSRSTSVPSGRSRRTPCSKGSIAPVVA